VNLSWCGEVAGHNAVVVRRASSLMCVLVDVQSTDSDDHSPTTIIYTTAELPNISIRSYSHLLDNHQMTSLLTANCFNAGWNFSRGSTGSRDLLQWTVGLQQLRRRLFTLKAEGAAVLAISLRRSFQSACVSKRKTLFAA